MNRRQHEELRCTQPLHITQDQSATTSMNSSRTRAMVVSLGSSDKFEPVLAKIGDAAGRIDSSCECRRCNYLYFAIVALARRYCAGGELSGSRRQEST
jgi:hypothetical protein